MEFILNTFSSLSSMPLIEYVAGGFVFACVFFFVYKVIGVKN